MKILHTSDWHLGKNLEGRSRLEEQELFLNDFIEITKKEDPDMIIIAGDIYDSFNPPAKAEQLFYHTLKEISKNSDRLVLAIAGNHDSPERLSASNPLAREYGILLAGSPNTRFERGNYGKCEITFSFEGGFEAIIRGEKVSVVYLPFPSEKRLNEVLYHENEDEEERLQTYFDKISYILKERSLYFKDETINIIVSHLFVEGSKKDGESERKTTELGNSLLLDPSCFPKEAQYIALGHVHKPQTVPGSDNKCFYSGSPIPYNKSERNYKKKLNMVEIYPKKKPIIKDIFLPVYKPIEEWNCDSIEQAIQKCKEHQGESSYVYLNIKTDRYIKEDELKEMKSFKDDILEIIPVLKEKEETEDKISNRDKSFLELFYEFYQSERAVEPDKDTVDMLSEIIREESDETAYFKN